MRLFDDVPRYDATPASYQETYFPFLNRVATPFWADIRRVLEEWFANVLANEEAGLRSRFRSPDDRQHVAAFWEIYLHELFLQMGYSIRLHPTLPGKSTKPDMLVERDGEGFYVEALALTDSVDYRRAAQKRGQVYDAIDERVRSPNFFVNVETLVQGTKTPPLGDIAKRIGEWLAGLDPDMVPP